MDIVQLEDYFLTRLHMGYHFPKDGAEMGQEVSLAFDYDTLKHNEVPLRRMLCLRVAMYELDAKGNKAEYYLESEIKGQFLMPENMEGEAIEVLLRVNGLSILYSTLRGIIGNVSGSFPGGRFCLPTIFPPDVVKRIERRKAEAMVTPKKAARKTAQKKPKKRVAKKKISAVKE